MVKKPSCRNVPVGFACSGYFVLLSQGNESDKGACLSYPYSISKQEAGENQMLMGQVTQRFQQPRCLQIHSWISEEFRSKSHHEQCNPLSIYSTLTNSSSPFFIGRWKQRSVLGGKRKSGISFALPRLLLPSKEQGGGWTAKAKRLSVENTLCNILW